MPRTEEEYRQQLAEDAGPQPDEMVRLQMALDATEEEVARLQMVRDAAEREIDALRKKVEGQDLLLRAYRLGTRPPERAFTLLAQAAKVLD